MWVGYWWFDTLGTRIVRWYIWRNTD